MRTNEEALLRAILAVVARQAFPPRELYALVAPKSGLRKQVQAYNLCDGSRTQSEVAKAVGLDQGNFSKSVKRWIELGIMIKVFEDGAEKPIHVYPIPEGMGAA
jgi:hypothetical protein